VDVERLLIKLWEGVLYKEMIVKAVRIHGRGDVRYEEVPNPKADSHDVLIRIRAAGVCGTDIELCDGVHPHITTGKTRLPLIPGHEWSGEVIGLGDKVRGFDIGDKVTGECSVGCRQCEYCFQGYYNQCENLEETGILNRDGGFAESISFPSLFLHKFSSLSFEEAALTEPTAIAIHAVTVARVSPKDYVAIVGPGPIGLLAVQVAKAFGAGALLLSGTRPERLELGGQLGADVVVNVTEENLVRVAEKFTHGHKFDVVIEATGNPDVLANIESIIRPYGRIILVGSFGGQKGLIDLDRIVTGNISLLGVVGSPNVWEESIRLLEAKKIQAAPLITHRFELSHVKEGLNTVRQRIGGAVKVLFVP
jgi:2-desacetyl-2-hydroxyethyl bacteriochlorophyllide A dehydrogenase